MENHELALVVLGSAVVFSWSSYAMEKLKHLVADLSKDEFDTDQAIKGLLLLFSTIGSIGLFVVGIISGLLLSLSVTALLISW